jgi:hypothetical protein
VYIGYTILCTPLVCIPLAAMHYLLLQPVSSAEYHIPSRSLLISSKKIPFLTFMGKLKHSFRPTFTYRTNELRCSQRCNKLTAQQLPHPAVVQHNSIDSPLNSSHALTIGSQPLCCSLATNPNVCFASSMAACAMNPYAAICPCPASTGNAIPDSNCRLERVRCECTRFVGECNQAFVQEF